jgi:hypothetical protein
MRIAVVTLAVLACTAPPAAAARVDVLVVGREAVLREARITQRAVTVKASGRRCRVGAATPLAALARTRLPLRLRDYGSCGPRPQDAGSLFVTSVGGDRNRGRNGWVYKSGRRTSSLGAGDPASRLRPGARVVWFWCVMGATGCQRTLAAVPARSQASPGESLTVTVTGYDDAGAGVPVAGATVRLGSAAAVTGADGRAQLTVPPGLGTRRVVAERDGMVRSFAARVVVR